LRPGLHPGPHWKAYSAPGPLAGFRGIASRRGRGKGNRGRKGGEGRREEVEGRGKGGSLTL